MDKTMKNWLCLAALLCVVGGLVFAMAMTMNAWDFTRLSTTEYETNTHEVAEDFQNIRIETDTADIVFLPATDGKGKVVCYESEKMKHSVTVENGCLTIRVQNEKKWYDYIGINFVSEKVTVYLPKSAYSALSVTGATSDVDVAKDFSFESADIEVSTGDVRYRAATAGNLSVTVSTGDIFLDGVSASDVTLRSSTGRTHLKNTAAVRLSARSSTGDVFLESVILTGKLSVGVSTGDVIFDGSDAGEIAVSTSTGDVFGTLLSGKNFDAETGTGDVSVPKNSSGGRCEIKTGTGDIRISVEP